MTVCNHFRKEMFTRYVFLDWGVGHFLKQKVKPVTFKMGMKLVIENTIYIYDSIRSIGFLNPLILFKSLRT